jgi:hypothetical protein
LTEPQRRQAENRFKQVSSGQPITSTPGVLEDYMSRPPEKAAEVDLEIVRLELNPEDYAKVRDYVTRAQRDPKGADVVNRSSDAQFINTRLTGLNFTGRSRQDDRARLFAAIDKEIEAARQGNNGRISVQDRERIFNDAIKLYVTQPSPLFGFGPNVGGGGENASAIEQAKNLSFEQLRARQNFPVLRNFAASFAPGRTITPADVAGVEAIRINEYSGQERANYTRAFRQAMGRAPTPYELRAYIYLVSNAE